MIEVSVALIPSLYGNDSGSFGVWKQDNNSGNNFYNLPYYRYTLDQINDKTATIFNSSVIYQNGVHQSTENNITDHVFQFGNDRITVIASNYGYVKLRMDETGSKFLNDFCRSNNQFGGGVGYITTNDQSPKQLLSTFFKGNTNSDITTERDYSFYYRRYYTKSIENGISLEQTLMAPFGTDPVVISKVTIKLLNDSTSPKSSTIKYFEAWDGFFYPFVDHVKADDRRNYQMENYEVAYTPVYKSGNDNMQYLGMKAEYMFKGKPMNISGEPGGFLYDETPPTTFLVSLGEIVEVGCNTDKFYGDGGVENPTFNLDNECQFNMSNSTLIINLNNIPLTAEGYTTYFMYGYIPYPYTEYSIEGLMNKYVNKSAMYPQAIAKDTAKKWYDDANKFNNKNYPEISREILWCYGMMRTSLSFYNLFNEFIIDQGTQYKCMTVPFIFCWIFPTKCFVVQTL